MKPRLIQLNTRVAYVDDDIDYVSNFGDTNPYYEPVISDQPHNIIPIINHLSSNELIDNLIVSQEENEDQIQTASLLIREFPKLIDQRLKIFHAIVIDFNMPMMSGLDFCSQIRDKNITKIMLTGHAEDSLAIKAFNDQIITHFVKKTHNNLLEHVYCLVNEAYESFFNVLSNSIISFFKNSPFEQLYNLKVFWQEFDKIYCKYKITQFALYDTNGSFVMTNRENETLILNAYLQSEVKNIISQSDYFNLLPHKSREEILSLRKILNYKSPQHLCLEKEDFNQGKVVSPDFIINLKQETIVFKVSKIN